MSTRHICPIGALSSPYRMGSITQPVSLRIVSPPALPLFSHSPRKPTSISLTTKPPASLSLTSKCHRSNNLSNSEVGPAEEESPVESLKVPDGWLDPSKASEESDWLRVTLHKWLDDEYCPEPANVEISKVAARSYYESLMANKTDLGEILLNMVGDLKYVSFQESFHGVFSSANAAVHLITSRISSFEDQ